MGAALLSLAVSSAATSTVARPLILVSDGNLWRYSERAATRDLKLTSWGHNWGPSLSPDGRYLVYGSDARRAVESCQARGDCQSVTLPSNVWWRDLVTDRSKRIATQPERGDPIAVGVQRSRPVWSPDGSRVGWTEILGGRYRLAVYSFSSRKTGFTTLKIPLPDSGDEDAGTFAPDQIVWDTLGIIVPVASAQGSTTYTAALLLQTNGSVRRLTFPHEISGWLVVATDGKRTVIAGYKADFVIDPRTGVSSDMPGKLEAFASGAKGGLSVVANGEDCELYRGNDLISTLDASNGDFWGCDVSLAPDGSRIAYVDGKSLVIEDGSSAQKGPPATDSLEVWDWGRREYRIRR